MESAASFLWRTVLIYFFTYLVIRLMGKREIGKLSVFDLVISIMITEMAVFVVEEPERPIWHAALPMAVLAGTQIAIAYIQLKSRRFRLLFEGKPSPIIENGRLNREEMGKQRYSLDDLLLQLREKNVVNVADVEFAVLEPTGRLTLLKKDDLEKENGRQDGGSSGQASREGERASAKAPSGAQGVRSGPDAPNRAGAAGGPSGKTAPAIRFEGLPVPLIMDGKVQNRGLEKIGQTRFWLQKELKARGVKDVKDVFLCTIDHRGRLFIDMKT